MTTFYRAGKNNKSRVYGSVYMHIYPVIRTQLPKFSIFHRNIRSIMTTEILPIKVDSINFHDDLPTINDEATKKNLQIAAEKLKEAGGVVGFPTETVYGLGGSALCDESVKAIYKAKNRPADNPLIVHVSSVEQLKRKLLSPKQRIPSIYNNLIEAFWPGPLTILLPIEQDPVDGWENPISKYVTAGQSTFGVRIPQHPVARALIALSDTPLAAPSANASTRPSPTQASHVYYDLQGKIPYILDGGSCEVGVESTVIDGLVDPPMLLRPGGISLEDIIAKGGVAWKNVIKAKKTAGKLEAVKTPGMKYRHYSPNAQVVLFNNCGNGKDSIDKYLQTQPRGKAIALLKLKNFDVNHKDIAIVRDLGKLGSEISRNLFASLREVDQLGVDLILVEGIPESNEGLAIMNRLSKAALETIEGQP